MMIIVFVKSTVTPFESVIRPSSKICNRMLNTSGCAFSISSNSTMEYGERRTASVNCPPSSYPTYPGGAPTSLDTENFSMYSDISIRTILDSSSNSCCANALATSVLPTPVGPRNMKEPNGRFSSWIFAFERMIASDTRRKASGCPITRFESASGRCRIFCLSVLIKRDTSICVHWDTIFAIISSSTT